MPELPEVETTKRGLSPFLLNQTINEVIIRQQQLRFPVSPELQSRCQGQIIQSIFRRAKYLLIGLSQGYLVNHLGMTGHLRLLNPETPAGKHDHLDFRLSNNYVLRYNDPRRFGFWLYLAENPHQHPLLSHLGPEPLTEAFNGEYLYRCARNRRQAIKSFIMRNEVVVGIGNIYATESLYLAGIHPQTPAGSIKQEKFTLLVNYIKQVLEQAIEAGGTTLRDFYASDGKPGYFSNKLLVYGRKNLACYRCGSLIQSLNIGGRSSAFCPTCQNNC